jgi:hypothetical protein
MTGLAVCSVVLAMVTNVVAQSPQQGIAKIVNIKGDARFMVAGSTAWQQLKVGTILKAGTVIQTAGGSYVDVVLNNAAAFEAPVPVGLTAEDPASMAAYQPRAEQDALRIYENTVLGIDKLSVVQTGADTVTETQLDLKHGRIFGAVKKLAGASRYEVKIPTGVAGIRGTVFFITSDGLLSVLSGSVVLAYIGSDGNPVTQVVTANQQFDSKTGKLTALPAADRDQMILLAQIFSLGPRMPATVVPKDHTIETLSPNQPGSSIGPG